MSASSSDSGRRHEPSAARAAGLAEAAGQALQRLASNDPRAVLVTGRDPGVGAGFARVAPGRWLVAPGRLVRQAVAAGVTRSGRTAVAICEDPADARTAPWHLAGPLVAVTESVDVASAAWEAGIRVAAPAWPADVIPLLSSSTREGPICLYLHHTDVATGPPLALEPPSLGAPRVVTHGDGARLGAAGAPVTVLLEVAWHLARRGRPVTTLQLTCLTADGPGPRTAAHGIFWDAGDRWESLPTATLDRHVIEALVASRLGL